MMPTQKGHENCSRITSQWGDCWDVLSCDEVFQHLLSSTICRIEHFAHVAKSRYKPPTWHGPRNLVGSVTWILSVKLGVKSWNSYHCWRLKCQQLYARFEPLLVWNPIFDGYTNPSSYGMLPHWPNQNLSKYLRLCIPVVPHKAVAEVSKIGNL